ncbi:MAG: HAD-IA family hydrolase [Defluviitaleaceae bacterium]|nr:HAD-IA family hydrolase [Defluviitaleaceae bacterium]
MFDLILFDLDGTLTNPKDGIINSFLYMMKTVGASIPEGFNFDEYIGPPLRDTMRIILGDDSAEIEEAITIYRKHQAEQGLFQNYIYPGIADLLYKLKRDGKILAVATSKMLKFAVEVLEHFGLLAYFDFIAGAEADGARSDKAEVIAHVLDTLDKERKMKIVMVGDRKYDIIGAKAHGIPCIGVLWGFGSNEELLGAGADAVVKNMNELYNTIRRE